MIHLIPIGWYYRFYDAISARYDGKTTTFLSGTLNAAKGQYETLQWTVIKHIELSITNSKLKVQYGGNLITLDLFLLSC